MNEKALAPELKLQLCALNRLTENIPRVSCFHPVNDPIFSFLVSNIGTPCWKGHTNSLPDMSVQKSTSEDNLKNAEGGNLTWGVSAGIDCPVVSGDMSKLPDLVRGISQGGNIESRQQVLMGKSILLRRAPSDLGAHPTKGYSSKEYGKT